MRLLCITDIHGELDALEAILSAESDFELVLLGGDLTNFGKPRDAAAMVDLAEGAGRPVLAVAGNCDSAEIDEYLDTRGVGLHAQGRTVGGIGFCGLSAMPPWMGNMYEFPESELDELLRQSFGAVEDDKPRVLVSHCPPSGCVDRIRSGDHVGSTAVRNWVERERPHLVVSGHVHEARGVDRIGETVVVNCGTAFRGFYAVAHIAETVDVELREVE